MNKYIPAVATGGAAHPDFKAIMKLKSRPTFAHDNDDAGRAMLKNAQEAMHFDAFTVPDGFKDVDEYIRSFSDDREAWDNLWELYSQRTPYYRFFKSVAVGISQIRSRKDIKEFRIYRLVAEIIVPDLNERGVFYKDSLNGYYFHKETKKLIKADKHNPDLQSLLANYGVNPSEKLFSYMLSELEIVCYNEGIESDVHRFAYYNPKTNTCYVSNNASIIYKITSQGILEVDNGTDGVLFLTNRIYHIFKLVDDLPEASLLTAIIINKINFGEDRLELDEKRYLFEVWLLGLFFEAIMPTKPVMAFIGEKGSGKSVTMRKVGMLKFGPNFDVTPLPNEARDFDTIAINSYFLAIDNADSWKDWLEDRIATIATGGSLKSRKLYTNNEMVEVKTKCFLAITARTPYFRRDDIADRLLIMNLARIDEFKSEKDILNEVLENRDVMMTELLKRLQTVLKALENKEISYSGKLRMADFADFAIKVAAHDGKKKEIEKIFNKIATEQSLFTLERDPLVDLISQWLQEARNQGRPVENKELYKELKEIAIENGETFSIKNSSAFVQRITNIRPNLRIFFDIEEETLGGNRKAFSYNFRNTFLSEEEKEGDNEKTVDVDDDEDTYF